MPGAVETDSKMEKKKRLRRKRRAAIAQESTRVVEKVFTIDAAYAKFRLSAENVREPSNDVAVVRDGSTSGTLLAHVESSICHSVRNQTAIPGKATGPGCQESCITEDGSGSENSGGIESTRLTVLSRRASGYELDPSVAAGGKKKKRKRVEEDVNDEVSEGPLQVKAQKLSEEARVWQYVCKRSVFVSPPQRSPIPPGSAPLSSLASQFGVNQVFKEKTHTIEVSVNDASVKVTITKESSVAQEWIEQQTGKCFGLDLEWQPNRRKGQPENKVALLQISSGTECLLIQMLFLDSIPSALVQFLNDPERKLAGVGIHGDTKVLRGSANINPSGLQKLRRDFELNSGGEVELCTLAVDHYKNEELKRVGLKALAKHVLGYVMTKSKTVTMSNWSKSHLDRRQVEYACIDAWVSHAIFCKLQESPVLVA